MDENLAGQPKASPTPANQSLSEPCLLRSGEMQPFYGTLPMNEAIGYQRARLTTLEGTNVRAGIVWLPVGQQAPPHDSGSEHIIFLLEGALEFEISDQVYRMEPRDMFFIPVGVRYLYKNVGTSDVRFLNILGKIGDRFVKGKYYLDGR